VVLNTNQLLSVPYSLYSLNSGNSVPGPVGPQGPQGVPGNDGLPGPQGPSGSFPPGTQFGQMNYWDGTNWVNIPPGNVGSQLVNCNGIPSWFCTPSVLTLPVSNITSNGASCSGIVTTDGGLSVTSRGVVYGTTMNPTLLDNVTNNGTGIGTFSSTLIGLTPQTTYYVRAYATNSLGTGYGNEVEFGFIGSTIPMVSTFPVSNITSLSATCGGFVTSDGGLTVTGRGVVYATTQNPTLMNNVTMDGTGTGSFTSTMTGLVTPNTYYVRAYATNSLGTSYGNEESFSTSNTLVIGSFYAGGIVFYLDSTGQHGLVCAPSDQGAFQWGCYSGTSSGALAGNFSTGVGSGQLNTNLILNGCGTRPIAASVCSELVLNGYDDWFLPSLDELSLMYSNLRTQALGGFLSGVYWSSSQKSTCCSWNMSFATGNSSYQNKNDNYRVRAVRAF